MEWCEIEEHFPGFLCGQPEQSEILSAIIRDKSAIYPLLDLMMYSKHSEYKNLASRCIKQCLLINDEELDSSERQDILSKTLKALQFVGSPVVVASLEDVLAKIVGTDEDISVVVTLLTEHVHKSAAISWLAKVVAKFDCEDLAMSLIEDCFESESGLLCEKALELCSEMNLNMESEILMQCFTLARSECSNQTELCKHVASLITSSDTKCAVESLEYVIEMINDSDYEQQLALMQICDACAESAPLELSPFFPELMLIATSLCEDGFDDLCARENGAACVSFDFVKHFSKSCCDEFWEALGESFSSETHGSMFAYLTALHESLESYDGPVDSILEVLITAADTEVHSIQELSVQVLYDLIEYRDDDVPSECALTVMSKCLSGDHEELDTQTLDTLSRMLFTTEVDASLIDQITGMIDAALSAPTPSVRSHAAFTVAAFADQFRDEAATHVASFVPMVYECACKRSSEDPAGCCRAIEALGLSLRCCEEGCEALKAEILEVSRAALTFNDRQMYVSACWALKHIMKCEFPEVAEFIPEFIEIICGRLATPIEEKDSIDDTGVSMSEVMSAGLNVLKQVAKHYTEVITSDLVACLCDFYDLGDDWDCEDAAASVLENIGFYVPEAFVVVVPKLTTRERFWPYITTYVDTRHDIDVEILEMIREMIESTMQQGDARGVSVLSVFLKKGWITLSPEDAIQLYETNKDNIDNKCLCDFVELFSALSFVDLENPVWTDINRVALDAVQLCETFEFKPSPIEFLNSLLVHGFTFTDDSIDYFLELFSGVLDSDGEGEYRNATLLAILNVVLTLLTNDFNFDACLFLTPLLELLPPTVPYPVHDIYNQIARLHTHERFSAICDVHTRIFIVTVRTLALEDDHFIWDEINESLQNLLIEQARAFLNSDACLNELLGAVLSEKERDTVIHKCL